VEVNKGEISVPVDRINQWLKDNYGSYDNKPKFRLVFANEQREKRLGTFTDYVPGTNIFLREITEVREVAKYNEPNFKDCYVLEKLVPNYHKEVTGRLSYEPCWVYDKRLNDGSIKHPTLEAVMYFMRMAIDGPTHTKEFWDGMAEEQQKETESYYENVLGNEEGYGYRNHAIVRES
jgi:hypothetical protein